MTTKIDAVSILLSLVVTVLLLSPAASRGQDRPATPRPEEREPGPDGPQQFRFGPPRFALQEALDKDSDGKVSADELKSAVASLKSLDRNSDGKLDAQEIGWPPQFGDRGRGGRGGGGRGGRGFGPGGRGGEAPVEFSKQIMNRDANRDGKVSADELPRSMRRVVELADADKDGAIDEAESEKFAKQYGAIGRSPR